jgi:hypothetical protein
VKDINQIPSSERGAVLVHVALALLALMALSTFVIDYGVLWTTRRQAQNAADAAALAGAVALAFDDHNDRSDSGPAKTSAYQVVMSHPLWGQQPNVSITYDITFPPCPDDGSNDCIQVYVYRSATRSNPLPMIFGQLVGLSTQGVKAMAIAKMGVANATNCLKPWGVIDRWDEHHPINPGTWTTSSIYEKYLTSGPNAGTIDPSIPVPDEYIAPTPSSVGSGFHPYDANMNYTPDYGLQINLTVGDQNDFQFATGWFAPLALQNSRGGNDYSENIKGCVGVTYSIGQQLNVETEPGLKVGPTQQAVETDTDSIINTDPGAYWDGTLNGGHGGVANSAFSVSPRIVAVPLINPDEMAAVNKGGRTTVTIANIMGFFVEGYNSGTKSVTGRLMTNSGLLVAGGGSGTVGNPSGFMRAIFLIR